jgi:transposase
VWRGGLGGAYRLPTPFVCQCLTSELVTAASQHVQHMEKALTQMNLQIHHVISDITGVTGLAIVDATDLARLRDPLADNWRSEHLFTVRQSCGLSRICQRQIVHYNQKVNKTIRL